MINTRKARLKQLQKALNGALEGVDKLQEEEVEQVKGLYIESIKDSLELAVSYAQDLRELNPENRFSQFTGKEINHIALALEYFEKENQGILNEQTYQKLMNEIKDQEEADTKELI